MNIKHCPYCDIEPEDLYVKIQCPKCGLTGPWANGGINDDHADNRDHEVAILNWKLLVDNINKGKK
jgi:hypothetical protein